MKFFEGIKSPKKHNSEREKRLSLSNGVL